MNSIFGERYLPSGYEAGSAPEDRSFRPDVELKNTALFVRSGGLAEGNASADPGGPVQ
jgi:hypothetical protein